MKDDQNQVNDDRIMLKQQVKQTEFVQRISSLFYFRMLLFDIFVLYLVIIKQIEHLLIYQAKFGLFLFISIFINLSFIHRRSPVFHAFLSNLPKVVDYNFSLGTVLLPFFLSFLQFSKCSNASMQFYEHISATNTLGRIDPSIRDSWLMILIIILYKVNFSLKKKV
jgi:hypothetical protein